MDDVVHELRKAQKKDCIWKYFLNFIKIYLFLFMFFVDLEIVKNSNFKKLKIKFKNFKIYNV